MNLRKDHYRGRGRSRASGRAVCLFRARSARSAALHPVETKKKSLRAPVGRRERERRARSAARGGGVRGRGAVPRFPLAPPLRRSAAGPPAAGPVRPVASPPPRVPRARARVPHGPRLRRRAPGPSRGPRPAPTAGSGSGRGGVVGGGGGWKDGFSPPFPSLGRKPAAGPRRGRLRRLPPGPLRGEAARTAASVGGRGPKARARGAGSRPLPPAPLSLPPLALQPHPRGGRGRVRGRPRSPAGCGRAPEGGWRAARERAVCARGFSGRLRSPRGRAVRAACLLPGAAAARRRVNEGNPGPREEGEVVAADDGRAPAGGRSPEGRRGRLAGAGFPLGAPSRPPRKAGGRGRHPRGAFGSFPSPQGQVPSVRASARPGDGKGREEEGAACAPSPLSLPASLPRPRSRAGV